MEHRMNYNDTLLEYAKHQEEAKKILNPSCRVCKICNGRACAGRFTNTRNSAPRATTAASSMQ